MNLIIDIGNSRVKVAVMDGGEVVDFAATDNYTEDIVKKFVSKYDISRSIVSSTRGLQSCVVDSVGSIVGHCLFFDTDVRVPIDISYATPHTLGRDRLAAAVGAREMFGEKDMLIVDFGTAITIDLVTRQGGFEGGSISAGVMLRFRALHDFTAVLPLCEPTFEELEVARTTKDAVMQGVMNGICY
ncbi:MAG: type III pantothenate kinase [Rikenellaceae bacterium]